MSSFSNTQEAPIEHSDKHLLSSPISTGSATIPISVLSFNNGKTYCHPRLPWYTSATSLGGISPRRVSSSHCRFPSEPDSR